MAQVVTEVQGGKGMKEKVKIESGTQAEIRTTDGKVHSGTIRNIEEESEVVQEKGWESRKWEAAVAAMQGLLAHKETFNRLTVEGIVDYSFRLADALVKRFKEDKND